MAIDDLKIYGNDESPQSYSEFFKLLRQYNADINATVEDLNKLNIDNVKNLGMLQKRQQEELVDEYSRLRSKANEKEHADQLAKLDERYAELEKLDEEALKAKTGLTKKQLAAEKEQEKKKLDAVKAYKDKQAKKEAQQKIKEEKKIANTTLFGDGFVDLTIQAKPALKKVPPLTKTQLLNDERQVLGLYFSGHPLTRFKRHLQKLVKQNITALQENPTIGNVEVAGIVARLKKRQNKQKQNWAQLVIEDESQSITANAFSRTWENISGHVEINQPVIVSGEIRGDELSAKPEIIVSNIESIITAIAKRALKIIIHLPQDYKKEDLFKLDDSLKKTEGLTMVYMDFEENGKKVLIKTPYKIVLNNALLNFIEETFGTQAWDFETK